MTLRQVYKKYPEKYVVLMPKGMRDAGMNNRPLTFQVLVPCDTEEEAERARERYNADGLEKVFIMQTHIPIVREMSPENTAQMFRILYGME